MKKIITMLILVTIAGAVLIGLVAASNPDEISTTDVPAIEAGAVTNQEIID